MRKMYRMQDRFIAMMKCVLESTFGVNMLSAVTRIGIDWCGIFISLEGGSLLGELVIFQMFWDSHIGPRRMTYDQS